jgi:hypothetical protein
MQGERRKDAVGASRRAPRARFGCRIIASLEVQMRVQCRLFESTFKSWEALCAEAAAFATNVGKDRLISISVSQADTGGKGVVFVWFWE